MNKKLVFIKITSVHLSELSVFLCSGAVNTHTKSPLCFSGGGDERQRRVAGAGLPAGPAEVQSPLGPAQTRA